MTGAPNPATPCVATVERSDAVALVLRCLGACSTRGAPPGGTLTKGRSVGHVRPKIVLPRCARQVELPENAGRSDTRTVNDLSTLPGIGAMEAAGSPWPTSPPRGREGLLPSRQPKRAGSRRRLVRQVAARTRCPAVGLPEAGGEGRVPSMWGMRASHAPPLPFFVQLFVHLYVGQLGCAGVLYGHAGPCVAVGQ